MVVILSRFDIPLCSGGLLVAPKRVTKADDRRSFLKADVSQK